MWGRAGVSHAAGKIPTRLDLQRGRLWGPMRTAGRPSDRQRPFKPLPLPADSVSLADLGDFDQERWPGGIRQCHLDPVAWGRGRLAAFRQSKPSADRGPGVTR